LEKIVDDDADVTITFEAGIEDSNNKTDANKKIEVYTSNNPVVALSEFKPVSLETIEECDVKSAKALDRALHPFTFYTPPSIEN